MNGRVTAYIDMGAIENNFQNMKKNLKDGVKMIAVVKSDAYGHGAAAVAELAQKFDYVWGFAVAAVSEAKQLISAGIKKPVLILGYAFEEDYGWMAANGVRPAIFSLDMADRFAEAAKQNGVCAPVHIAVDTGMTRIGVNDTKEGIELVDRISALQNLSIEGVFTHFAKADEADKAFTREQAGRFERFCSGLEQSGVTGFLRHCSNSAAILEIPEVHMDMVRAGISIYGVYPSEEVSREYVKLQPAMSLRSHIVHLNQIAPGTSVSYGGIFTADRETLVATIPVGYADGYPRSLSGRGYVLVNGHKAPVIGRVCMDQLMADVTGIDVKLLDEVTLLGRDHDAEITFEELDRLSGRFPYEFMCCIGKRVPRVYTGRK